MNILFSGNSISDRDNSSSTATKFLTLLLTESRSIKKLYKFAEMFVQDS